MSIRMFIFLATVFLASCATTQSSQEPADAPEVSPESASKEGNTDEKRWKRLLIRYLEPSELDETLMTLNAGPALGFYIDSFAQYEVLKAGVENCHQFHEIWHDDGDFLNLCLENERGSHSLFTKIKGTTWSRYEAEVFAKLYTEFRDETVDMAKRALDQLEFFESHGDLVSPDAYGRQWVSFARSEMSIAADALIWMVEGTVTEEIYGDFSPETPSLRDEYQRGKTDDSSLGEDAGYSL